VADAGAAAGATRYRLLETVRQYAAERLRDAGEAGAARAAHAAFFVAFAERAEPHLFAGAGDAGWVARVRAELANLRAAAAWAAEDPARAEDALRLGAAVYWFWFVVGQYEEARRRLAAALDAGVAADPVLRGRALTALAFLAIWQGDAAGVRPPAEAAAALLRGRAGPDVVAPALVAVSAGHVLEGDGTAADHAADEAIAVASALTPRPLHSLALFWRGWAALVRREPEAARAAFEAAVENGRRTGHPPATAHPLAMLGRLAHDAGDLRAAAGHYRDSLAIHAGTDDAWGIAVCLEGLARVAAAWGHADQAVRLLGTADSLRVRIASVLSPAERSEHLRLLAELEATLGGAAFAAAWADGQARPTAEAVALAAAVGRAGPSA
jgi:tetratricopeptide (TPR) repeat protein